MKEFEWEIHCHLVVLRPVGENRGTLPQKPLGLSFDSRDRFPCLLWESLEDVLDREIDELSDFVFHLDADESADLFLKLADSANSPLAESRDQIDAFDYAKGVWDWLETLEPRNSTGMTISNRITGRQTFTINLDELEEDDDEL